MPKVAEPSANWATENVIEQMEERTPPGQATTAQIFLADTVSAEDLSDVAKRIVEAARESAGEQSPSVTIGKIHRLARSFSVKAAPSVIRQISTLGQVKAVLPSEMAEEMLIRPVKKTPVP